MKYDAVIVGGGISGLTSAAFLCKSGHKVLLCEKEDDVGGLVGSFDYKGFTFDAGIRATENSGVLFPMLKKLDIDLEFLCNPVSLGIEDNIIDITSKDSLVQYQNMLTDKFPDDAKEIEEIMKTVKKIMDYMDILYGIDNPLFLDIKQDREYLIKTILPWMFKYIATVGKIKKYNTPIEDYLKSVTDNEVLVDIIAQHFFSNTPAFFALSYFSLYLDYKYPKGGTGKLIEALKNYITAAGGQIETGIEINKIDLSEKTVSNTEGTKYSYKKLIWAADLKTLYSSLAGEEKLNNSTRKRIKNFRELIADKTGGDSVLTLYLTSDLDKEYFGNIHGAHFFYTPRKQGLGKAPIKNIKMPGSIYSENKNTIFGWVKEFIELNTFEISIPVLRDETLAPEGKTGLIISVLMDYSLVKHIENMGWYDEFKQLCKEAIVDSLRSSVYPELKASVTDGFVSTPLTMKRLTGNTDGAITGWSFTNGVIPAVTSMPKIARSIDTPIPDVVQAGQWTYSPSGLPISILTGKLAADNVIRKLKR